MDKEAIEGWGERLAEARRTRVAIRPDSGPAPANADEAYAIQAATARRLGEVRGFKISALTPEVQAKQNVDRAIGGALMSPWVVESGATLPVRDYFKPIVECEYAFELAKALPARVTPYSREEVEDAIGALRIVIEIPDSRFDPAPPPLLALADFINNGAFIVGPRITSWRDVDYRHAPVVVSMDGKEAMRGNAQPILDGDPVGAVVMFANAFPKTFEGLKPGHILTTGTTTGAPFLGTARDLVADFGPLGQVRATFA